jgi:hypothetical protein
MRFTNAFFDKLCGYINALIVRITMTNNWQLIKFKTDINDTDSTSGANIHAHDIEKGSKAKLIFTSHDPDSDTQHTEYLWVEILLVDGDKYLGQLHDQPKHINDLSAGEMIEFEEQHIYEYEYIDPFNSCVKV